MPQRTPVVSLRTTRTGKIMDDAWLVIVRMLFHSVNVIRNALNIDKRFHNGQISAQYTT